VVPEFSYFGHENALELDFAVPLQVRTDGSQSLGQSFDQSWSTARDFTRVLRSASFGQKEANLYVSLGRTTSETLGDGQAMRYFTPNVASRALPAYLITPNALSLAFDINTEAAGGSLFLDDLFVPRVLGLTGYLRPAVLLDSSDPVVRALTASLTYTADYAAPLATDPNQGTGSVHALGETLDAKLYGSQRQDVKAYLDGTSLIRSNGIGFGGALGIAWHGALGATFSQSLRLRAEGRLSTPGYLPSYFDLTYALDRFATVVDNTSTGTVMSKLQWLDTLSQQSGRMAFYTEATYQPNRRASLGLAYEDGRAFGSVPVSVQYPSRNLMFFARMRNLYVGDGGTAVHVHVAYDLRHFDSLTPVLSSARGNEYAFAALSLDWNTVVQINGSIRKALNPSDTGNAAIDAALDVAFHYEL